MIAGHHRQMASYLFGANGNGEKRTDEETQAHWKEVTKIVAIRLGQRTCKQGIKKQYI